jgi:hypothetical protein
MDNDQMKATNNMDNHMDNMFVHWYPWKPPFAVQMDPTGEVVEEISLFVSAQKNIWWQ